ncbi:MAG: VOC family protein [Actinobacteria bacterium]|nr:VOC family protein [Actinomycetota bacterium]
MGILAVHTLIHSDDAPATRAFLRDVLGFPFVSDAASSGDGFESPVVGDERDWLIFGTGPSELGVHPTSSEWEGQIHTSPLHHEIALVVDDIDATVADLAAKGATFAGEITDRGFGRGVPLEVPGADPILLYEARHTTAYER